MRAMITFCLCLLGAPLAAADGIPDGVATDGALEAGVAAYEGGAFGRAHALLAPLVDAEAPPDPVGGGADAGGGPVRARYLMARLLSGDLPERQDMPRALALLDPVTRCASADALNLYAFLLDDRDTTREKENLLRYARLYKESALAGSTKALLNLGLIAINDFDREVVGGSYIFEASRGRHPTAMEIIAALSETEPGRIAQKWIEELAEKRPVADRWPLLEKSAISCPALPSHR